MLTVGGVEFLSPGLLVFTLTLCFSPSVSGALALLALGIYSGVTVTFFGKRFLDWSFSWSYISGWVAIILAFVAGIYCIYVCRFIWYILRTETCVGVPQQLLVL